jgi:cell filamentation protein
VDFALDHGQDKVFMVEKPGEIMGYLAYGHPFLDGNGRTIMVVHGVLAQRAGFSVDWAATTKSDIFPRLRRNSTVPARATSIRISSASCAKLTIVLQRKSLKRPASMENSRQNEVLGQTNDPALQARYEQQELKRKRK